MKVIEGNTYWINGGYYERVGETVEISNLNKRTGMTDVKFDDNTVKRINTGYLQRNPEKLIAEALRKIEAYKAGEKTKDIFEIKDNLIVKINNWFEDKYTMVVSVSIQERTSIAFCVDSTGIIRAINTGYLNMTEKDIKRLNKNYINY